MICFDITEPCVSTGTMIDNFGDKIVDRTKRI